MCFERVLPDVLNRILRGLQMQTARGSSQLQAVRPSCLVSVKQPARGIAQPRKVSERTHQVNSDITQTLIT